MSVFITSLNIEVIIIDSSRGDSYRAFGEIPIFAIAELFILLRAASTSPDFIGFVKN